MSYTNNKTKSTQYSRPVVATPASASEALHQSLVVAYTAHFSGILSADLLISNRKACYATVINGTMDGKPLEQLLGTENAKVATEQILQGITANISTVPSIA